ncbi:DUF2637 domain-containing protein [Actinoallomurus sp. NPDC050550]|uniref:DUF2637 domain-containing protein n=1 Tax=Actinoallomurus sp. NPDC050550 TaxID=3154937 RepID=UPI0033C1B18A
MTDSPAPYSTAQRRLLTAAGGLGVAALAGATFVLSYDDLRALAVQGGAARHWAYLYPGVLDGLIVVVILSILTARRSRWWARAVRWLLLLVLIAGAGAAGVERAVHGYRHLSRPWLSGGVAAAPWVILAIAVWLWLSMIKQVVRTRRRDATAPPVPDSPSATTASPNAEPANTHAEPTDTRRALIPGLFDEEPADTRPLPRPAAPRALGPAPESLGTAPGSLGTASEPDAGTGLEPAALRDGPLLSPELAQQADRAWQPGPALSPATAPDAEGDARDSGTDPLSDSRHSGTVRLTDDARGSGSVPLTDDERGSGTVPLTDDDRGSGTVSLREDAWDSETVSRADTDPADADPDPEVNVPVNETPVDPEQEEPPPRWVARTSLPTDVRLVGPPQRGRSLGDTQPDGIRLADTDPDGIPIAGVADAAQASEEEDAYAEDRAEDPDAGDASDDARSWAEQDEGSWQAAPGAPPRDEDMTPPSSKFRSSPTPPRD